MKVEQRAAPKISGGTQTKPSKPSDRGVQMGAAQKWRGKEALRSSVEFAPSSLARRAYVPHIARKSPSLQVLFPQLNLAFNSYHDHIFFSFSSIQKPPRFKRAAIAIQVMGTLTKQDFGGRTHLMRQYSTRTQIKKTHHHCSQPQAQYIHSKGGYV